MLHACMHSELVLQQLPCLLCYTHTSAAITSLADFAVHAHIQSTCRLTCIKLEHTANMNCTLLYVPFNVLYLCQALSMERQKAT